ncbi:hypothetical protein LSTR_LSTR015445 [Laodelphax striatellus]|uniref:Septin-type G domain-containing protein n=1 Tax=Laodelphax striatellus TaxID=195883 RepID=A0A482WE40_LAOST|nr:hypothetical protein LSTR_LSTR015445 [Laodelphax striatellus]
MLPVYFRSTPTASNDLRHPSPVSASAMTSSMTSSMQHQRHDDVNRRRKLVSGDSTFCLSCPPNHLGFMEVLTIKPHLAKPVSPPYVENPKHSDFSKLRNMLITTHMQDLKDVTEDVHYENFRAQCISQISQQAIRERGKLKRDSNSQLECVGTISETDRLLIQKDEEIRRMQDMLAQMQEKLKATSRSQNGLDSTDLKKRDIVNV